MAVVKLEAVDRTESANTVGVGLFVLREKCK